MVRLDEGLSWAKAVADASQLRERHANTRLQVSIRQHTSAYVGIRMLAVADASQLRERHANTRLQERKSAVC